MQRASILEGLIAEGRFVVTAEVVPPLAAAPDEILTRVAPLRGLVDAVNVTDAAGARTTMSSLVGSAILVQAGFEPVLQITCRDRNRIALAADLIGAGALGIKNMLILRGDDPSGGDQPDAKPVFDLESSDVMALARTMRDEGRLGPEREIIAPPHFFIGGADTPRELPDDFEPTSLAAKIEAGAQFAQTQFCFDVGTAERYTAALARHGITDKLAIILGVGPIATARSARWMNENLFGVSVPDAIIERLENADDERAEGRAICKELVEAFSRLPHVAGVHLMAPMQGARAIADVLASADIARR